MQSHCRHAQRRALLRARSVVMYYLTLQTTCLYTPRASQIRLLPSGSLRLQRFRSQACTAHIQPSTSSMHR